MCNVELGSAGVCLESKIFEAHATVPCRIQDYSVMYFDCITALINLSLW